MKTTDIISVNPGKNTLAHSESLSSSIFRSNIVNRETNVKNTDILSLVFPSTGSGINELKKYALPLRALFATILIVSGLTLLQSSSQFNFNALGILEIIFGGMLAIGLFTRIAMAGSAIYFAVISALSIRAGIADITTLSLIFGSLLFCILGSGKYSADMMIKQFIIRRRNKIAQKRSEEAMGYKAFHYAKF